MTDVRLIVDGLPELRRALKRVSAEAPKRVNAAHLEVARQVIGPAKARAPVGTGPKAPAPGRRGHLRDTIRSSGTLSNAIIRMGNAAAPHAMVHEWGGTVPLFGGPRVTIKPPKRGGYILYPAIRATARLREETYLRALDEALKHWND